MTPSSHVEVAQERGVVIVGFVQRDLVDRVVGEVAAELYALADGGDCPKLLLDFAGVDRMSSEMVGKLLMLNRKVRQKGSRLKLCGLSPYLRQILVETKLDTILDLADTRAEAVEAFQ